IPAVRELCPFPNLRTPFCHLGFRPATSFAADVPVGCLRPTAQKGRKILVSAIVIIFVIAYAAIALEHPIKINKSASALVGAGLLWTVYAVLSGDHALVEQQLNESVSSTAQIVFFLIGAMTIVEVIDA